MSSSSSGTALIRDSTDCADTTRTLGGGALSSTGGIGELGWLRYGEASMSSEKPREPDIDNAAVTYWQQRSRS